MNFTPVTKAINDLEAADKAYEGLTSADAAAQAALVNAQATAEETSKEKSDGKAALVVAADAAKQAIADFELGL